MTYSRLGILIGSTLSAVIGYIVLNMSLPRTAAEGEDDDKKLNNISY